MFFTLSIRIYRWPNMIANVWTWNASSNRTMGNDCEDENWIAIEWEKSYIFGTLFFNTDCRSFGDASRCWECCFTNKRRAIRLILDLFFLFSVVFVFLLLFFIIFRVCRRCSWINWMLSGRACCNFYRLVHRMWMDCESVKEPRDNRSVYLTLMNAKTYNAPAICSLLHAPAVW